MNMHPRRAFLLQAATGLLGSAVAPGAMADTPWPTRPLKVVVPFTVGGATDIFGRVIAEHLSRALGQPVIVDNKPGANGLLGNDAVAKAAPDGHTLLMTSASATVMADALGYKTPYNLERDLQPIAPVVVGGVFLLARPEVPASNLPELVALLRANPGKYPYGSWGIGSTGHLLMEALKHKEKLSADFIAYKGGGQVIQEMVSGVVPLGWADPAAALSMVQARRLKVIAISGSLHAPHNPEVRTMAEQGYDLGTDGWSGFFTRRGVPSAIVERLNREINAILEAPDIRQRLRDLNSPAAPVRSVIQFEDDLRRQTAIWRTLVQKHDINVLG